VDNRDFIHSAVPKPRFYPQAVKSVDDRTRIRLRAGESIESSCWQFRWWRISPAIHAPTASTTRLP